MKEHYHLIGIGGIGMSGIARLLLRKGCTVSGSDIKDSATIQELLRLKAKVFIGHRPENIENASLVIYSSAVALDNPEMTAAGARGITIIKRAQALADLMKDKIVITVSGSHGKTTTSSLASHLLSEAGLSPTVAVGGIARNIETNAYFGEGDFFVAEADESDGSFLYYEPAYSIITNIDREHLDYYKSFQQELLAFEEFIKRTKENGCLFACADDVHLRAMIKSCRARSILFGLNQDADIFPKDIQLGKLSSEFDCLYKNKFVGHFHLALGGMHNISNALSVIALGLELGIDLEAIKSALLGYKGTKRRLEVKFDQRGYLVVDDYAHHPTEIKATLAAVKTLKRKRIIAAFQPHRYTRTQLLLNEFAESFDDVDYLIITDIYAANENPIEGVSAKNIIEKIKARAPKKEVYLVPRSEILRHLLEVAGPEDLVITLGAGDITKISDELAKCLAG